jgi:hypothetical protein
VSIENRLKNKEYTLKASKSMPHRSLITMIITLIGVKEETAKQYLDTLLIGIYISRKHYKLIDKDGGLQCLN